uniref:Ribonuclease H-like domain-containing protein n=1 Tax=Tanacetum cinerariifolium TaxID=118510 RepID=A0A6L2MDS8_TANCI|nr:ribonuclease H-like domain-containing protein [Tanacetum cinerariifolium]
MAGASSISTVLRSLNSTSYALNPKSNALFVKSKDITLCNVRGFINRNLQYDPMFTISRKNFVVRSNITPPPGVPLPSGPPSGSMRNWVVGIVLTFVLPFFTHKWGPLLLLKNKVDTVVNTAEYVVETLESVATKVDNVIDRITDDLPVDSKLRKSMVALDELVEGVAKAAHIADDIIDKVEEVEDKLESLILEEAKVKEVSKAAVEWDFTRDNNYTIEFDVFGFSVKDYLTRHILFRCDSSGDLYPVTKPSTSPIAFLLTSASTWHQRLGHPGDQVLPSCPTLLQQIIGFINNEFDMTDLGALTGLFLSQKKYALQLLERAHMVTCNPSQIPVDTESKLGPEGAPVQDPTLYCSRGLQYLTFTRPDLSYAVQQICLYMHDPREPHFADLKHILRYVQGTLDLGLHLYASSTTTLVGYTDADWAGCPSTRSSTSGYCVFLGENLLSWFAKRQHNLLRSSAEAEYQGVANVVAETTWLCNLLRELHSSLSSTTLVYCDMVSDVYMSANPVQHQRTKHIEINIYFVRDMVTDGQPPVNLVPANIIISGGAAATWQHPIRWPPVSWHQRCRSTTVNNRSNASQRWSMTVNGGGPPVNNRRTTVAPPLNRRSTTTGQPPINGGQPSINGGQPPINGGQPPVNDGQKLGWSGRVKKWVGSRPSRVATWHDLSGPRGNWLS